MYTCVHVLVCVYIHTYECTHAHMCEYVRVRNIHEVY